MSKRSSQRHRHERRQLERQDNKFEQSTTAPIAIADETRALSALEEIIERKTKTGESVQPRFSSPTSIFASVYRWALSCMAGEPGERASFRQWDAWYRKVSKDEPFLAGVLSSVVQTDANRGWTLTGGKRQVTAFTDKLHGFDSWVMVNGKPVKSSSGGWRSYISWQSQAYHTTRMGCVSETGREGRAGPLFTLWSVDPCRAELTGNPSLPLRYFPANGPMQEWAYDQFIRGKSLVSTDEAQSGYGCPAVERCYQLAKVMVAIISHYQQKLNAKTPDAILTGKYISEEQWKVALEARSEALRADTSGYLNYIATIMNSGGDMPEFALTMLSSLPDRWDIELWTKILMRGYELAFGYKGEFSWENAGVMGRGNEVQVQHRNATAQGGKDFILSHQEQLQSVLPPTLEFAYEERDVTGEQEDAALKLTQAQVVTEMTKWLVNAQSVLTSEQVMQLAVESKLVPDNWTPFEEDVTATDEEVADSERVYRACVMFPDEPIVRYSWPSGKRRVLYRYGADRLMPRFVVSRPQYLERAIPMPAMQAITSTPLPQPTSYPIQERGNIESDVAAAITMAVMQDRFDPDQPRDEQGQWTDTGANNEMNAEKLSQATNTPWEWDDDQEVFKSKTFTGREVLSFEKKPGTWKIQMSGWPIEGISTLSTMTQDVMIQKLKAIFEYG